MTRWPHPFANLGAAIDGWPLTFAFPGARAISPLWNGAVTRTGANVSVKDAGYNAEYAQWSGLFIPSATPEPVAQRLRAAARAAASDTKVKEVILGAGSPVMYMDAPDFERYVQADARRMSEVVKKIGKVE